MAKTRKQKEKEVMSLAESLGKMKAAVFLDFTGLSVGKMQDLRKKLKVQGASLKVVKKRLFNLALNNDKNLKSLQGEIKVDGPLSLALGYEDEITPAKVLIGFKKEYKDLIILGGILENRLLTPEEVIALAKLPDKEEMRAQIVRTIAAPLSNFVNVLAGNLRNLIYILKNISEKGESKASV